MTKRLYQAIVASAVALAFAPAVMAAEKVNTQQCVMCHNQVSDFHKSGSHKKVSCTSCHTGLSQHLKAPGKNTRPVTSFDPKTCGTCHPAQYQSMYKVNDKKEARVSKKLTTGVAPDPFFDRAMGMHGFTKEHNEPRSHVFAAVDQYICDRAFGGRFEPKDGWLFAGVDPKGSIKVWDVVKDLYPDTNAQKPFRKGTAAAANPVCLTCKTTDLMLDWAYLGDNVQGTTWSRESNVVDAYRNYNHAVNCQFCHDPHSAKPRIVRDALIQALTRTDIPTLYSEDAKHTKIDVKDMGVRGFTRKIATLEKADSKLMCAQCHVEYNCNPGFNPKDGSKIGMKDQRTNVFPFVKVKDVNSFYEKIGFKDFKHPATGANLTKMQHPDVEVYWGSKHDKAGVDCKDCHMPKVKGKNGKMTTVHWTTSPRNYIKQTCLSCHKGKTEKQMNQVIGSMKAYYNGKLRETESRMNEMFNAFNEAQNAGVSADILAQARVQHDIAHTNWESWTAANGAYFHNLPEASESLAVGAEAANKATKILRDAIRAKNK